MSSVVVGKVCDVNRQGGVFRKRSIVYYVYVWYSSYVCISVLVSYISQAYGDVT